MVVVDGCCCICIGDIAVFAEVGLCHGFVVNVLEAVCVAAEDTGNCEDCTRSVASDADENGGGLGAP